MLLKKYADYLRGLGRSEGTIRTYCRKLQKFLDQGYSENDLLGGVDQLILSYSKGGNYYDPNDSGNTLAALKRLKDYIREPYMEGFFVAYEKGYSSFVPMNRYVSAYTISDGTIEIVYKNGFHGTKTVNKTIPKTHYDRLIDIFIKYQKDLSDSDTAMNTVHGYQDSYRYVFGGSYGANCAGLFDNAPAMDEYCAWRDTFIK